MAKNRRNHKMGRKSAKTRRAEIDGLSAGASLSRPPRANHHRHGAVGSSHRHIHCPECDQPLPINMPRPELFLLPRETIFAIDNVEVNATYDDMTKIDIAHMPYDHCIIGVTGDVVFRTRLVASKRDPNNILVCFPDADGSIRNEPSARTPYTMPAGTPLEKLDSVMQELWESTNSHERDEVRNWEFRFYYIKDKMYAVMVRMGPQKVWTLVESGSLQDARMSPEALAAANRALDIRMDAIGATLKLALIVLLATKNAIKTRTKDKLMSLGIGRKRLKDNNRPLYTTSITIPKMPATKGPPSGRTVAAHLRRGHVRNQKWGPRYQFTKAVWIAPIFVNADETYVSTRVAYNTNLPPHPDQPDQPDPR